jgi:hypothetical protein
MRILVFMTSERETADQAAVNVKSFLLGFCQRSRTFRNLLTVALYGWASATAQAGMVPVASSLDRPDLATATITPSLFHGPESFYPFLGVIAAVACTYILRRRRIAQLEAASVADR